MGTEFSSVSPEAEQYGAASAGHFAFPLFISTVERGCFCSLDPDVFTCTLLGWGRPVFPIWINMSPLQQGCANRRLSQACFASPFCIQLLCYCFCRNTEIFGCMGMSQIFHPLWEIVGFVHRQFDFWNENAIFFLAPLSIPNSPYPEAGDATEIALWGEKLNTFCHKSPPGRWQQVLPRYLDTHNHPLDFLKLRKLKLDLWFLHLYCF